jgi:type I restriction enzyme M protein
MHSNRSAQKLMRSPNQTFEVAENMAKPKHKPSLPFPPAADTLHRKGTWLWIPLRKEWRDVTTKPEEVVRQHFLRTEVEHYGYLKQHQAE